MKTALRKLRLSHVEDAFIWISGGATVVILLFTTANVIGRYAFNRPIPGSIEIPTVMIILLSFLGVAAAQRMNIHIGMDAIIELARRKFPPAFHIINIFNLTLFFFVMAILGFYFIPSAMESKALFEETAGPLFLPVWPFKLCIAAGCLLPLFRIANQLYGHIRGLLKPKAEAETGGDRA